MPLFWILVAGMMLLAFAFVLPPLLKRGPRSSVERNQLNIEIIRQQLAELEADLNNGKLDQSAYAAARNDLEKELLYDLSDRDNKTDQKPGKEGRWAGVLFVVSIPVVTLLIYHQIGASKLIPLLQGEKKYIQAPSANTGAPPHASLPELVAKLVAKLQADPDNPEGWFLLARSYMAMGRYGEAAKAYEQLHKLAGDHPKILVSYADALAMVHNGQLAGKPIELINKALAIEPNEPQGLWLAGMAAEQQGEYQTALNYWRRLEPMLKGDPKSQQEIRRLIAQAERKTRRVPVKSEAPEKATESTASTIAKPGSAKLPGISRGIRVNVTLDPDLSDQASPDDTLFVFARALEGPPMPLAIVRKQVKDLPLLVTLDDSMAISPRLQLSNFAQVRVSARISKSGNAMPQSGDLYGEVSPVSLDENTPVEITIAKVRP